MIPENEFDLEKMFLPAWAQEPASAKYYAKFAGDEDARNDRRHDKGDRRPLRDFAGPPGRDKRSRPREGGPRQPQRDERPPQSNERRPQHPGQGRDERGERWPAPAPLPEINIALTPDEKGVDSLTRQIKMTGRAYPLFDIAQMVLQKPERQAVTFTIKKKPDGQPAQPLFVCALDDTLWLSEDEAVAHVLKNHFSTFYQAERTATEPPKGTYTFVAQCGLSGVILGPPNYHDYQNHLRKLHADRFSRMPFEAFKARVKIVRDEAVVKKWIDDQSWKTEYVCLNLPEPLRLATREEVEKHFRQVHQPDIVKAVESFTLTGVAARALRSPELARLVRHAWEEQRHFPLQIATVLSQQFASRGLQFFKVNRTITHVSVARPHFLDLEATPVSEGVKQIVQFINAHPKCTRRRLMESLAPTPAGLETHPAPSGTASGDDPPKGGTPNAAPESAEPTSEQTAVIADLHWLIHQGHVIEFANGVLDTAKRPLPKPLRPQVKPAAQQAQPASEGEPVTGTEANVNGEQTPPPATEVASNESPQPAEIRSIEPEAAADESPVVASEAPAETAPVTAESPP